jgi:sodium transport system ATP-binding protein
MNPVTDAVEVEQLSKTFRGRSSTVTALRDVSFSCPPGEVFGIVGGNGAGKTTLLRILSTAIKPTSGVARILGHDVATDPESVRGQITFLSYSTGIYPQLTPREVLTFFGKLFNMSRSAIDARIAELAGVLDFVRYMDRACDELSAGTKQKVSLARALLHRPQVILFDEPATGLDIIASRRVVELVKLCKAERCAIIYCTHNFLEIEELCDTIGVMNEGAMLYRGTLDDLRNRHGTSLQDAVLAICKG